MAETFRSNVLKEPCLLPMEESVLELLSRKPDPRSNRYSVRLHVHYWASGVDGRGFTRNVSDSGLLIETAGTEDRTTAPP